MIIAAAIRLGEMVLHLPAPKRHHHILLAMHWYFKGRTPKGFEEEVQGFVTDEGKFLNRTDAWLHANERGQTIIRRAGGYDGMELFSEDLW